MQRVLTIAPLAREAAVGQKLSVEPPTPMRLSRQVQIKQPG